jgi:hypothetical protein
MIRDVNAAAVTLFFHVGDLIGVPCTDSHLAQRRATLGAIQSAVLYTPGDNEWTDCRRRDSGGFRPLERLSHIRATYFAKPQQSLGARPLPVETQGDNKDWSEFVENSRMRLGGFLFNTIHVVGSGNGSLRARGADSALQIAEVTRRNAAALHWVDSAFAIARQDSLRGVVFALHADPGFNDSTLAWPAHVELIKRLAEQSSTFAGQVLFIHGDSHVYRVDQPLVNPDTKTRVANFTRLETYGSPRIGWVEADG